MLKHYFITAVRILFRNKFYTLINLLGLCLGFTFSFLLLIYVLNEQSYDKDQVNRERTFRILESHKDFGWTQPGAPNIMAQSIKNDFPEVEKAAPTVRFINVSYSNGIQKFPIRIIGSTPDIFDIFNFTILEGNKVDFLKEPNDLIISRTTADLLFPGKKVLGQSLTLSVDGKVEIFTIKGIFQDLPWNSSVEFKAIGHISWSIRWLNKGSREDANTSWNMDYFSIYLLLHTGASAEKLQNNLVKYEKLKLPSKVKFRLQSIKEFYLGSAEIVNNRTKIGNPKMIRLMAAISFIILLIASINYILLSSARTMNRYKEIAVRIVAGASPRTIRCQFLGESVLLSVIAYILSILISINIISLVNSSFHQNMHFSLSDNFSYLLFFLLISILVGLISGSYVAFYYSGLKPVLAFSRLGGLKPGKPSVWKVLLIVQMVLFIGLILITTAIGRQITYLKTSDMGFDSKGLMYVYLEDNEMKQYHAILNELDKDPNILNAAGGDDLPPTNNRGVDILE